MANIGPSCSVTAVAAAVATLPGGHAIAPEVVSAFRTSTADAARAVLKSIALHLPTSPGEVLETLAARDPVAANLFHAVARQDAICRGCGVQIDGDEEPQSAVVTYEPPADALAEDTAIIISNAFGPCTVDAPRRCEVCGDPGMTMTDVSHLFFGDVVAISVLPPENAQETTGLPELPLELDLPTRPFSTTRYALHAAICATTPQHVVAYVAERAGDAVKWHRYDGTVHETDVPPPYAGGIDTPILVKAPPPTPPPSRPHGMNSDNEEEARDDDTAAPAAPAAPPPRARDAKGRIFYGLLAETAAAAATPEEAGATAAQPAAAPRPPTGLTDTPAPSEAGAESDDDANMAEETPGNAGSPTAERPNTSAVSENFRHGENTAINCQGSLQCPLCVRTWTSGARRAQQISHLNTKHAQEGATVDALKRCGVDRCISCGEFVTASRNARLAHGQKCGAFETRTVRNQKRARADATAPLTGTPAADATDANSGAATPRAGLAPPPPRRQAHATPEDEHWTSECPQTVRTLHKQEWGQWIATAGQTLLGYTAAPLSGRYQRQIAITELVRTHLARPRGGATDAPERAAPQRTPPPPATRPAPGFPPLMVTGPAPEGEAPPSEITDTDAAAHTTPAGGGTAEGEDADDDNDEDEETHEYTGNPDTLCRDNAGEPLPTRGAPREKDAHTRRILHQLSLGALGKAARTLFSSQMPRARVSDVLEQLRGLHPQEDPREFPHPTETPYLHNLKPEKVRAIIVKRLGRASAPGMDGWTRELLVPLTESKPHLQEMTTLLQDILCGRVSPSFAYRIRASVVHPFLKEAGSTKVRPITPESVWLKVASHIAMDTIDKSFRDTFRGWQFGVWGDGAQAVAQIRAAYANESADTLVALDATNAYNRMSRKYILATAYRVKELRHAFGVINLALGEPGALCLLEDGRQVDQLTSTRGVRQGMVLAPLLFATAMAATLQPLMLAHPRVKVTAYLDDLTVVGARADVQTFLDTAGPALAAIGFDVNPAKSHHLSKEAAPDAIKVAGATVPLTTGMVRILGAGFDGGNADAAGWVWERTRAYEAYFQALADERLPRHARLNLLRASALPRLNYLLRTHSPQETEDSAAWFDDRVLHTLSLLVGGAPVTGASAILARLPLSMGGFGLRSQRAIGEFAADSVTRKGAQQARTRTLDRSNLESLKPLLSEPELELVKANAAPGATRALVDPAILLGDAAFEVLARQRLLMRVLRPDVRCECGADADNAHINVCPRLPGGPRIRRHNHVLMAIEAWAARLGLPVKTEPRASTTSNERLDLTVSTATGTFVTDVAVTYPAGARSATANALQQIHAAKKRKWAGWAVEAGAVFAPLSFESTGGLHRESFQWMLAVAGAAFFPFSARTALNELLSSTARALHEGNAFVFEAARSRWAKAVLAG